MWECKQRERERKDRLAVIDGGLLVIHRLLNTNVFPDRSLMVNRKAPCH